ncbi:HDOD domain-containing protein [Glaciecola sp. MH2013]|nr:HDOD domain-containing protein [Glaciecola sp. MH2013]
MYSSVAVGLVLILLLIVYLYAMGKKSTIETQNPSKKRTSKAQSFVGLEKDTVPSLKLRDAKDIPEPSEALLNFELLEDIADEEQKQFLLEASSLKKPHPLLMSLTRDISDPQELLDIVKKDPELVVKVINVANSSLFALQKSITTINHAVVYLGVLQAKNISMQFALEHSADFTTQEQKKAYHRIWKASFLASSIGLLVAKDMKLENSAELSTRCLLDYLGDISLLAAKPEIAEFYLDFSPYFERLQNIQNMLGTNPSIMAKVFAANAKLPTEIIDSLGANALALVNKLDSSQLDEEQQKVALFSYIICRLTDIIVFERAMDNIDFEEISFAETLNEALYYSQDQVERYELGQINSTLRNAKFKHDVGEIVEKLNLNS